MMPRTEQITWSLEALECGEHVGYDTCIIHGGQGWPCAEAVALAEKVAARDQQVKAGAIDALADKWQWGGWSDALPLGELGITRAINTADAVTAWMRARAQHVRAEQSHA